MSGRPSWSGFLRFNLISVPVQGYNAAAPGGGKIGFHLLHAKCHERIRYKKVCPIHGEVSNDEIVSGYEVSKGKYVTVEKEERNAAKIEDEKTIRIDAFIHPDAIDPIFFSGRTYYLLPDGKVGEEPYAVLCDAMHEQARFAVARVVFAGRAEVAMIHPTGHVLAMTLLAYESELKKPSMFEEQVPHAGVPAEERKLAQSLISAATEETFDLGHYKDEYTSNLAKLVGSKAKRQKIVDTGEEKRPPAVINLMDALRKSLESTRKGARKAESSRSAPRRPARHGARKTG